MTRPTILVHGDWYWAPKDVDFLYTFPYYDQSAWEGLE